MNKKADLSIMILVIGIVAVCILTILSFVGSNYERNTDFLGIGLIETMDSISEEIDFYRDTKFEANFGKEFERGNVKISIEENKVKEGVYNITEQNYIWGCDGNNFKLYEKCEKELVKIIYKK